MSSTVIVDGVTVVEVPAETLSGDKIATLAAAAAALVSEQNAATSAAAALASQNAAAASEGTAAGASAAAIAARDAAQAAAAASEVSRQAAVTAKSAAEAAQASAQSAQSAAAISATNAGNSETAAALSRSAAESAASAAEIARAAAVVAKDASVTAKNAAEAAQTAAVGSASAASASAAAALASQNAAAASAAAALASQNAAAASAAAASVSQTSATASAGAAAASATSALNAIALAFKGGVAGASVPNTSTLAGDYYRVTSAGTSQGKTWAVGDMAIYNGTSGQWTQISGAIVAEDRVLRGDLGREITDALLSDGVTSNRHAEWTPGAAGAVGGLSVSFPFELDCPAANPSASLDIAYCAATGTAPASANAFRIVMGTGGDLIVRQYGATTADQRNLTHSTFRTVYSGQRIRGMVVFATPNSTTNPEIYVNGINITGAFTLTTATPPNWMPPALDCTRFGIGLTAPSSIRILPHAPIIGALTAAEVLEWTQTGRLPWWCEYATGKAGLYIGSFASTTDGFVGVGSGASVGVSGGNLVFTVGGVAGRVEKNLASLGAVIGYRYRITWTLVSLGVGADYVYARLGQGTGSAGVNRAAPGTYTDEVTAVSTDVYLRFYNGVVPANFEITGIRVEVLGPIFKPLIQPISVIADLGANIIPGILVGTIPLTSRRDWIIQGQTSTNGNQQLNGVTIFQNGDELKNAMDTVETRVTGTPTVSIGQASGGAQYKASGALVSGRNRHALITPFFGSGSIWIASNTTDVLQHTIRGHRID